MGLGREFREKVLEEEHEKYFQDIANKDKAKRLESEERFMELYQKSLKRDINILLVAVCIILGVIALSVFVVWQVLKAMF